MRGGRAACRVWLEAVSLGLAVQPVPSLDAARTFYDSDDYQEALKVRLAHSTGRVVIVDGPPPATAG